MDLGLQGRRALVTGSYRGTGAGIAAVLAQEGVDVVIHGFEPGQPDAVVASIRDAGGSATGVVGQLDSDDGAAALAEAVGPVDVVVANYGAPSGSSWASPEVWAAEWDRNVLSAVRIVQPLLGPMRDAGWGRIVVIGTVGARMPGPHSPGYYVAKAGLPVLVRSLARDLRGTGVTANLVSPGMIATAEVREMLTRRAERHGVTGDWADIERWAVAEVMPNLTGRIADPEDIGRVVAFVAAEPAWHITGADIAVDGGAIDA